MGVADYAAGWRARARGRAARNAERAAELRKLAGALAELLVRDFGATRVVLFGSVARGDVTDLSDIDLLVDGIATERFMAACAAADRLASLPVDLVPAADARPEVLERVEREGIVLHG